jgi:hypothetical protein
MNKKIAAAASLFFAALALFASPTIKKVQQTTISSQANASFEVGMSVAYAVTCQQCIGGTWTCDKNGKNCKCSGREVSC